MKNDIGYEFEIVAPGLEEQMKRVDDFWDIAKPEMQTAMSKTVVTVASKAKPLAPVGVSGMLRNSITSSVENSAGSVVGHVFSSLKNEEYPAVMEFGRRPGKMPPPSALERWVHIVLGVSKEEAPGVALRVARSIARRGIKGKKFMERGYKQARPDIDRYWQQALDRIAEKMVVKRGN